MRNSTKGYITSISGRFTKGVGEISPVLHVQHNKVILDEAAKRVIRLVAQSLNELLKVPGQHLLSRRESLRR